MSIDINDATVSREENLLCFKPEYRLNEMLKQQDYISAMISLGRKTIERESQLKKKCKISKEKNETDVYQESQHE